MVPNGICLPFLLLAFLASCGNSGNSTKPVRRNITQAVYASGKIYPLNYYRAATSIPGYIQKILVKVGDTVTAGQPLFVIKNEVSELSVASAKNNLELAQSNAGPSGPYLQSIQQDINAAREKLLLDSITYERYKKLQSQGIGTRQNLDQSETQYSTSREIYRKAQSLLQTARQRVATDLKNARNAYQAQQSQLNDFTVHATLSGKVYDILGKEGEYVSPQIPVMELGLLNEYEVELAVDETDINLVHPGMEVVYSTEAFGDTVYKGVIKEVYPKISQANKSIKALASINLTRNALVYAGSTLEANIVYARKKDALVVPKIYLNRDSATLQSNLGNKKVKIVRGVEDIEFVEVLKGLSPDDVLVKP